jgi:2-polyprenyl-6-methoxyphenol hydroxylase-like FAD-dependent oxidoreductase
MLDVGFGAVHFKIKKDCKVPEYINHEKLTIFLFKQGMSFISPMPDDSWIVAFDLDSKQDEKYLLDEKDKYGYKIQKPFTKEEFQELLKERVTKEIEIDEIIWHSHFRVNERLSQSYRNRKRSFIAGDSCHAHTPLGFIFITKILGGQGKI